MSTYIDAHCHLDLFQNIRTISHYEDLLPIKTITVTNSPTFFPPNEKLFENAENIRVSLGLHPELSQRFQSQTSLFREFIKRTKYIGEIGLDGSKGFCDSFKTQKMVLESILSTVKNEDNKILTIHTRNAASEAIDLINKYLLNTNCKIILHWYSGNKSDLLNAINSGYFFSINHKMTSSKKGKELIKDMPLNRILTETDAPFTLDERIKSRIESLDISLCHLAAIKGISKTDAKDIVYNNFAALLRSVPS